MAFTRCEIHAIVYGTPTCPICDLEAWKGLQEARVQALSAKVAKLREEVNIWSEPVVEKPERSK